MILTRVHLNPQRDGARKLIGSPQAMHAALLSGFPPTIDPGRVLWRLDRRDVRSPVLWMVSSEGPDLTHLEEQAGWPSRPTARSIPYAGLLDALASDQIWAFRLAANPTHRATRQGRKQIFAHVTAQQQTEWLLAKQQTLGVALGDESAPTFAVSGREVKKFRRGEASVTLGTATFDGMLRVVDPDLLRTALVSGIGRGKAYGCGLLTLARP